MKTVLSVIVLVITLLSGVSSLAALQGDVGAGENLQPIASSEIFNVPVNFADKKNLEKLLRNLSDNYPYVKVETIQALGEIENARSPVGGGITGFFEIDDLP